MARVARLRTAMAGLAVGAMVLAGCGDDDGDAADEVTTTVEDAPDTTAATSPGEGGGGGDAEGFCAVDDEMETWASEFVAAVTSAGDADAAEAAAERAYDGLVELRGALEDAAGRAPSELRGDVEVVMEKFLPVLDELPSQDDFVAAMRSASEGDTTELDEVFAPFTRAQEELEEDPEYQAAQDRISDWTEEHCGES